MYGNNGKRVPIHSRGSKGHKVAVTQNDTILGQCGRTVGTHRKRQR